MRWEIGKANGPLITRTSKPIIIRRIHPKRRKALNYYTRVTIPPGWDLLIRAQWPAALINVERDCEVSSGREKKSRGHSTLDLVHLPMPATRPLDFHSNRVGHRAGWQPQSGNRANFRPVPTRPSPFNAEFRLFSSFSFFLSSFFLFGNRKNARKGRKRNEWELSSDSFVKSWHRPLPRYLVYFREELSRIAKERLETTLLSFPPFHSRVEKLSRSCTFLEQVWKVDFWKGREWAKREKFLTVIDSTVQSDP